MSQPATLTDPSAAKEWDVWTTRARIVVTGPSALDSAVPLVRAYLADVDAVASRFRPDSEVCRLAATGGPVSTRISPLLRELLEAALWAARMTDGDVDPTLGAVLTRLGYPGDAGCGAVRATKAAVVTLERRSTWRDLRLDADMLALPKGTVLDLGATAKAYAADWCATEAADRLGCGVLVSLGGDLRVAGPEPADGWRLLVQDGPDEPASNVRLTGAKAVATSSTLHRRWHQGRHALHHVLDPVTGWPAEPVWRTATVAAATCLEANTWSTAAVVRGRRAPGMLREAGVDARLVAADGTVTVVGQWPA